MIKTVYKNAFEVLNRRPLRLWGVYLLSILLCSVSSALFAVIPGLNLAITVLIATSMTMILLRGFRGAEPKSTDLFDCFRDWNTVKRVLGGMGWMILWVFIWSLIPVAGIFFGIRKLYAYRLTPYILMTEPDVGITDAIKVSEQRTKGYKGKMFLADLIICAAIVLAWFILASFAQIKFIGWIFTIALFLFTLFVIAFSGLYLGLVRSAWYERISAPAASQEPASLPAPAEEPAEAPDEEPVEAPAEESAEDPAGEPAEVPAEAEEKKDEADA